MKPIILIGGGGHCKSVIEAAVSQDREIIGILDVAENVGSKVLDFEIIGTDDDIVKYSESAEFIITVGHIKGTVIRRKIATKISTSKAVLAEPIIASTANVSHWARVGRGTVVLHGAMVNVGAFVDENCIINTLANIEHDAIIEPFCHISTGAMVNGDCRVGHDCFLGSQSVMLNGSSIFPNCVIAAGSFVRKSITVAGIYAGNPAQLMIKNK